MWVGTKGLIPLFLFVLGGHRGHRHGRKKSLQNPYLLLYVQTSVFGAPMFLLVPVLQPPCRTDLEKHERLTSSNWERGKGEFNVQNEVLAVCESRLKYVARVFVFGNTVLGAVYNGVVFLSERACAGHHPPDLFALCPPYSGICPGLPQQTDTTRAPSIHAPPASCQCTASFTDNTRSGCAR